MEWQSSFDSIKILPTPVSALIHAATMVFIIFCSFGAFSKKSGESSYILRA